MRIEAKGDALTNRINNLTFMSDSFQEERLLSVMTEAIMEGAGEVTVELRQDVDVIASFTFQHKDPNRSSVGE